MRGAGEGRASGGGGVRLGAGRDWAELLRVSALFTVPGDALAGAAATGLRPNRRTALAIAASLSLYEAGMALNDWADRADDAVERPHRPLPSGRIAPPVALGAAAALTAGGLALAAGAGRPALTVATALAATVWAYDLGLKHTPAGPAAMAAARSLDLLLGAAATSTGAMGTFADAPRGPAGRRGLRLRAGTWSGVREWLSGATAAGPAGVSPGAAAAAAAAGAGAGAVRGGLVGRRGLRLRAGTWSGAGERLSAADGSARFGGPAITCPGTASGLRAAVPTALVLGAHTLAVTAVSRREAEGGSTAAPLGALAATIALAQLLARTGGTDNGAHAGAGLGTSQLPAGRGAASSRGLPGSTRDELTPGSLNPGWRTGLVSGLAAGRPTGRAAWRTGARGAVQAALAATYAATAARPLFHAALNPSPQLTQRAVGGGIRAMIPLQAALAARAGSLGPALLTAALAPAARKFGRKVSVT
ncbi:UbiA family prenyltransferase [Streptomyces sp. NPDC048436]|uniref:UbiA family prenyltransferase n=1 Tax=Streptomyces sp. NPDC048436 TaxID=3365550 RepID=UPI00371A52F6